MTLWSRFVGLLDRLTRCGVLRNLHDYRRVSSIECGENYRWHFRSRCARCGKEKEWRSR